jgi:hypothetical protein
MPRKPNVKTPEERSDVLLKAQKNAKKNYRLNTSKKRKGVTDDEIVVIKDMLVSLKVVGFTNSQCGAIVGLSRGQVKEICADPNFKSRLASVKNKLPEAALNLGRAYLIESVQAVVHVLRTEQDNALVLKAAAELFDRFGLPKLSKAEVRTDPAPATGDEMPETFLAKLKAAPPDVQEKVAALHESFTEGVERILTEGKSDGDSD